MSELQQIIPYPRPSQQQPGEDRAEWLQRWEEDYEAGRESIEPPRNTRFEHDPHWRERWLSIQNAHDRRSIIWKAAYALGYAAQLGFMIGGWLYLAR